MENKKNPLGNIYGSRLSKNGKWLNLTITAEINGEKVFITCPVHIADGHLQNKAYAVIVEGKATIADIPVYEDSKPKPEETDDECPF